MSVPEALILFDKILKKGFEAQYFISGLSNHFRDLLVCKDPITLPLLEVGPATAQRYAEQAKQCSNEFLYKAIELSNRCDLNYRNSNNKKLLVELTLIQLCQLTAAKNSQPEQQPTLQKVSPAAQTVPQRMFFTDPECSDRTKEDRYDKCYCRIISPNKHRYSGNRNNTDR